MINQADIKFIQDNLEKNVTEIALDKSISIKNKTFLLEQIRSRQKAKSKLPEFYSNQKLIFPKSLSIEQSSSELTAKYKASLFSGDSDKNLFADLTSGFGIDFYYLSQRFQYRFYNEKNERLVEIAHHNFKTLGLENIEISELDYDGFLDSHKHLNKQKYDLIFIDPSRRIGSVKVKSLEDYSPNILLRLDELLELGEKIMIKCSPMLDVSQAVKQLENVREVICVSVKLEVKEMLFILEKGFSGIPNYKSAIFNNIWSEMFFVHEDRNIKIDFTDVKKYIYEIDRSIIKLEMQNSFAKKYNLTKLAQNTNYFTSDQKIREIGLSGYEILEVIKYSTKELKKRFLRKYLNIKTRNFPLQSHEIKKKIRSIDGGNEYLFCFRDFENNLISTLTKKS